MKFVLILLFFLSASAMASEISIRGPGSSKEDHADYLTTAGAISYVDYLYGSIQNNPEQERRFLSESDQLLDSSHWNFILELERQAPLSELSLKYLKDLSERVMHSSKFSSKVISPAAQNLACKFLHLSGEDLSSQSCKKQIYKLSDIFSEQDSFDILAVESRKIELKSQKTIDLISDTDYNFTLLSSSHQPIQHYGKIEELKDKLLNQRPVVEGECDRFSTAVSGRDLENRTTVFFDKKCVRDVQDPQLTVTQKSWIQGNKWLYPLGALLLGGLVYAMKDKSVVIDSSAFR